MLNISKSQGNTIQKHSEISPYTNLGNYQQKDKDNNVGKDKRKGNPCESGGNVNWYHSSRNQYEDSSKEVNRGCQQLSSNPTFRYFSKLIEIYILKIYQFPLCKICGDCSVAKSCPALQPHGLQDSRLPCPPLSLRVCSSYTRLIETLEKAMAPHSSTLAWKIPWTEEPDRLQSVGSRRVGHH